MPASVPSQQPTFTILLPVHRPPAMLPFAIASVRAQERQDFELFVICDGAPPETVACAQEFAATDQRIRVIAHPKGEHHGELYRDQALGDARGQYVCQIGDDDLWLPNHLGEMAILLREVDFGNLPQVMVNPRGAISIVRGSLHDTQTRKRICMEPYTMFGPTVAGYRIAAYRSLSTGWTPPPPGVPSDVHMWRKFLARHDLRLGTRMAVTVLKFEAAHRRGWTMERRRAEVATWAERMSTPAARDDFTQRALLWLTENAYTLSLERKVLRGKLALSESKSADRKAKAAAMRHTLSWRLTQPFRVLGRLMRRSPQI